MSRQYIFNTKLNRRKPIWYLTIVLLLSIITFGVVAQEQQIDLVDPEGLTETQTLTKHPNQRAPAGLLRHISIHDPLHLGLCGSAIRHPWRPPPRLRHRPLY